MDEMMDEQPDFMLNLSASPFDYAHAASRIEVIRANVERYKMPVFYVNHVGGQTDVVFDGGSIVMSPDGLVYDEMPYFAECIRIYDLEDVVRGGRVKEQPKVKTELIHDALLVGIRDYFHKLGFQKAVLGLSGGIDSAVVVVLAAKALGAKNVRVLLMPSQFSSDHSINDARQLAQNLGVQYDLVPIQPMYESFENALKPHFSGTNFNVTEENLQARIRGMLLMGISNKFGHILLNTTNKSEMAVGYGTLYGDMCGGIAVLGDVYKTEVYELAHYLNKDGEVIPKNSLEKPPSAELRPGQKDSDSLPPYEILDKLLFQYIENRQGPRELLELGFDDALIKRVLRMVNINEFKREQAAPVIRISTKAFGMGRRMPIVGKYLN
jgi:NAD+ synthase (glutamine-hydrolysing)